MSRHRDIRNLDYDEEYDEAYDDSIYGHSYDENEYGTSPTTVSQYLYNNSKDKSFQIGAFFPSTDKIDEENSEEQEDHTHDYQRRDSSNFERPRLSSEDDVRLNSVLDQIRNVVGDHFSDEHLIATILAHKFDYEASLNAVLCNQTSSAPTPSAASRLSQPDDNSKFRPFSYMVPLSFSFSSAFVLKRGNYERVPVTKYIKEWQTNIKRISKDEKESFKNNDKSHKEALTPLTEREKQVLNNLHSLAIKTELSSPPEPLSVPPGFQTRDSPSVPPLKPPLRLSGLAALASKHMKTEVSSVQSVVPPLNGSSLSALASAHFSTSSIPVGLRPTSVPPALSPAAGAIAIPTLTRFGVPAIPPLHMGASSPTTAPSFFKGSSSPMTIPPLLGSPTSIPLFRGSESPDSTPFGGQSSSSIDLNIALNRHKLVSNDIDAVSSELSTCDVEMGASRGSLDVEEICALTGSLVAKRLCVPSSQFSHVILSLGRRPRKRTFMSRLVYPCFAPFTFNSPSPDDLVLSAMTKQQRT